jgi:ubiquitin carboxyl-terminal hydrolase 7
MEALDEKVNGAPPMDIDEPVSVRDRASLLLSTAHHLFIIGFTDEAFAAKHMPDLGHDVKEFRVFSWKLTGWKKLEKKLTSPEFDCGGHHW